MLQETITSRFLNQDETPEFRSLYELKEIFKSSSDIPAELQQLRSYPNNHNIFRSELVVRININAEDFFDFSIKRLDYGTFLLVAPDEAYDMIKNGQIELLVETLSQDRKIKLDIILSSVLLPYLDVELVASLPAEMVECLYNAIAGGLKENQSLLTRIQQMPEDDLYRIYVLAQKSGTRPSEMLAPNLTCHVTPTIIDLKVMRIAMRREGRVLPE